MGRLRLRICGLCTAVAGVVSGASVREAFGAGVALQNYSFGGEVVRDDGPARALGEEDLPADVRRLEDEYHVHPELTAHDELAAVNSDGSAT